MTSSDFFLLCSTKRAKPLLFLHSKSPWSFASLHRISLFHLALFLSLSLLFSTGLAFAKAKTQKVLVLHSYHEGFLWTDNVMSGIDFIFSGAKNKNISLYIEYMDTKRFPPAKVFPKLTRLYATKYSIAPPDVVISSDDNAFRFLLQHGDELFPGAPVVFCGVNNFSDDLIIGHDNITGVLEDFDIKSTVELMLSLHPKLTHLAVITDATATGALNLKKFQKVAPLFTQRVSIIELSNLTTEELLSNIHELPKNSAILNLSFFKDRAGRTYSTVEGNSLLTKSTSIPIYSCWDFYLYGTGIVGGKLVSGRQQGIEAAAMAQRLLSGESIRNIPIMRSSPNRYMFDYPSLRKAGLQVSDLPPDSIILDKPETFYTKYRPQIIIIIVAFIIMLILIVVMAINIMLRRRVQQELKQTVQELDTIFENSQVGIVYLQGGRFVSRVNQRLAEIFGYASPDEINNQSAEIFHKSKESYLEFGEKYYTALTSGKRIQAEYETRRKDGELIWALVSGKAIDTASPPDLNKGVIWVLDDITERKQAEAELSRFNAQLESLVQERTNKLHQQTDELKKANARLQMLDAMKSSFLSTVSHDLRTPLTSILGFVKLIIRDFTSVCNLELLPEESEKKKAQRISSNLAIIEEEAQRLTRLINDCLDLSRIEEGKMQWNDQRVAIDEIISRALVIVKGAVSLKPLLSFQVDIPDSMPHLLIDPDRAAQVFVNLLNNAVKFSDSGEIRITAKLLGESIVIQVSDQGRGIPEGDIETIFDKFYQTGLGDTVQKEKGSGMGLAICRQIVEHYGGKIWAESAFEKGSTFTVQLPIRRSS